MLQGPGSITSVRAADAGITVRHSEEDVAAAAGPAQPGINAAPPIARISI